MDFIASGFDVTASAIANAPIAINDRPNRMCVPVNVRIAPNASRAKPVNSSTIEVSSSAIRLLKSERLLLLPVFHCLN